jgi:hypothetical protein
MIRATEVLNERLSRRHFKDISSLNCIRLIELKRLPPNNSTRIGRWWFHQYSESPLPPVVFNTEVANEC